MSGDVQAGAADRVDVDAGDEPESGTTEARLAEARKQIEIALEDELDDGDRIPISDDLQVVRTGDRVSIESTSGLVETDAETGLLLGYCLEVLADPRW